MTEKEADLNYGVIIVDDNSVVRNELVRAVKDGLKQRGENPDVREFVRVWEANEVLQEWHDVGKRGFGIVDLVPYDYRDTLPGDAPYELRQTEEPLGTASIAQVANYVLQHVLARYVKEYQFMPVIYTFIPTFLREHDDKTTRDRDMYRKFRAVLKKTGLEADVVQKTGGNKVPPGTWKEKDVPLLIPKLFSKIDSTRSKTRETSGERRQ